MLPRARYWRTSWNMPPKFTITHQQVTSTGYIASSVFDMSNTSALMKCTVRGFDITDFSLEKTTGCARITETVWDWSKTEIPNYLSHHKHVQIDFASQQRTSSTIPNSTMVVSSCASSMMPNWIWKPWVIQDLMRPRKWLIQFSLGETWAGKLGQGRIS